MLDYLREKWSKCSYQARNRLIFLNYFPLLFWTLNCEKVNFLCLNLFFTILILCGIQLLNFWEDLMFDGLKYILKFTCLQDFYSILHQFYEIEWETNKGNSKFLFYCIQSFNDVAIKLKQLKKMKTKRDKHC